MCILISTIYQPAVADTGGLNMGRKEYLTDVALISVTNTEFAAVMHFHDWKPKMISGDDLIYDTAEFERDGKTYTLVSARQDSMGMTSAAVTAMKIIENFRPRYIIMVGIAAGIALDESVDQMYGDVIIPDTVWNYSSGKYVPPEKAEIVFGDLGFIPRFAAENIPAEIFPYIIDAINSPENECHVHVGPMACGSTVVANSKVIEKNVHSQMRDTAGLDMESYAVVYAANRATEPRPIPIIIKSICDFADSKKADDYQKFAAYTSCEFAKLLYEKYLPME